MLSGQQGDLGVSGYKGEPGLKGETVSVFIKTKNENTVSTTCYESDMCQCFSIKVESQCQSHYDSNPSLRNVT